MNLELVKQIQEWAGGGGGGGRGIDLISCASRPIEGCSDPSIPSIY